MMMLRINEPTPSGGAYSELYYLNDPVLAEQNNCATSIVIKEFDAEGKMLQKTLAICDQGGMTKYQIKAFQS